MTSQELRQSFLEYFRERGHSIVPSAPVIPHGDPTLYFTNAGMNQFKDVFLGTGTRDYVRASDTQKCIRVSGKHNDLEEVGHDTYHHTFFEMLGNWSFGDYYKEEAIQWAWELLTVVWGVPPERLHVTVFKSDAGSDKDQEAYDIWARQPGMDPTHIHWFGEKDNFWEMGDTGPCGPCSEIHYDNTPDLSGSKLVNAGVPEVVEIWNLVFIQSNRRQDGSLEDLPAKHVDTGMGFERICAVMQGKESNYDTDVFAPLLNAIEALAGVKYNGGIHNPQSIAMRVIADHVRALTFAIADGASPGNTGRGYVLRRLLRRAIKYAFIDLNLKEPVLYKLVGILVETMGNVFPEIQQQRDYIEKIIRSEEETFMETLEQGVKQYQTLSHAALLNALPPNMCDPASADEKGVMVTREKGSEPERLNWNSVAELAGGDVALPAADAFLLYDTFGFPLDLTDLLAREQGMRVDKAGFDVLMEQQRKRARDARKAISQEVSGLTIDAATHFTGFTQSEGDATVIAVLEQGVVLDSSPFYAEMGGQVADTGEIIIGGESFAVGDVQKIGDAFLHILELPDTKEILTGEHVLARIDKKRRAAIQRNHSVTHILHEALRRILGNHVQQAGSLVAPDHLRFDFNHFNKLTDDEVAEIEGMVNEKIREAIPVVTEEMPLEEARKLENVKMFFGDKYGSTVRVVTIDPAFSREFCGGTHVMNSADIGFFKILTEASIQSGVRRIDAISGSRADEILLHRYREIDRLARRLGVTDRELYGRVEALLEEKKTLEKELAHTRLANATGGLAALLASSTEQSGIRIVTGNVEVADIDALKALGDELRNKLGTSGVGVLGTVLEDKVALVAVVTDDITGRIQAGKIVGAVAKLVGGGGGGKAHMATAGGKQVDMLETALASVNSIIAGFIQ